jgi:hypothetical protein
VNIPLLDTRHLESNQALNSSPERDLAFRHAAFFDAAQAKETVDPFVGILG